MKATKRKQTWANLDMDKVYTLADAIEAFINHDGGDRDLLCIDIWDAAKPKIEYYWRDGAFEALEELRTKELYSCNYNRGRGL